MMNVGQGVKVNTGEYKGYTGYVRKLDRNLELVEVVLTRDDDGSWVRTRINETYWFYPIELDKTEVEL